MELFGILLSAPFLLVASVVYAVLVGKVNGRWPICSKPLLWASFAVITLFMVEVIAVVSVNPIAIREAIGSLYYPVHLILFFLIVPSIVNVMRIQRRFRAFSRLWAITPPTILQTAPAIGGSCKRERSHLVDYSDGLGADLDPFDQCTDNFPSRRPVAFV